MHQKQKNTFWKTKSLAEMSEQEWESLCDRCGRCCMHKLEDPDSGDIAFTDISCRLFDQQQCKCKSYEQRHEEVPACLNIRQVDHFSYHFLPKSCAYRRLHEGRGLAAWHPLVSGHAESVHQAGISVRSKTQCESEVDESDFCLHIIDWIDA